MKYIYQHCRSFSSLFSNVLNFQKISKFAFRLSESENSKLNIPQIAQPKQEITIKLLLGTGKFAKIKMVVFWGQVCEPFVPKPWSLIFPKISKIIPKMDTIIWDHFNFFERIEKIFYKIHQFSKWTAKIVCENIHDFLHIGTCEYVCRFYEYSRHFYEVIFFLLRDLAKFFPA